MALGRPSLYTPELAAIICQRLAAGESLRSICNADGMPAESTVRLWDIDDTGGFSAQYTRARNIGLDVIADEVMAIADDGSADRVIRFNEKGGEYQAVDQEHIARSRLRFDARRWYLSKLAPKKYGDRIQQEVSGPGGTPVVVHLNINPVKPKGEE